MAFPSIVGTPATTATTSGFQVAINMPSDMVAGELLVAICAGYTDGTMSQTGGTDWTLYAQGTNGAAVTSAIFMKLAQGGDTLAVNFEANDFAAVAFRVQNHGVTTISSIDGGSGSGTDGAPTPPLMPTGATNDYLWIEAFAAEGDDETATYWSTNYTGIAQIGTAPTTSCMVAAAYRQFRSATQNPGAMALGASHPWFSWILAIPPNTDPIGIAAASGTGALTPTRTVALSGAAATASAGTLSTAITYERPLTGSSFTASAGIVTAVGPASGSAHLTGQEITSQTGTVVIGPVLLSGSAATFAAGSVTNGGASVALVGSAVTCGQGTLAPSLDADDTLITSRSGLVTQGAAVALAGSAMTGAQGTLITSDAQRVLSGSASTMGQGTLSPKNTAALLGQAITGAQGQVGYPATQRLTGQAMTSATGALAGPGHALTGQATTFGQGTLTHTLQKTLTGQALHASQGALGAPPASPKWTDLEIPPVTPVWRDAESGTTPATWQSDEAAPTTEWTNEELS